MIRKLRTHKLPGDVEIMFCGDPNCTLINSDGTCDPPGGDTNCVGLMNYDGDCPNTGDQPCGGLFSHDQCGTSGDTRGCSGIGKIDLNISYFP